MIRKPVATKVHINMSAALLLANVTFLVGIDEVSLPSTEGFFKSVLELDHDSF